MPSRRLVLVDARLLLGEPSLLDDQPDAATARVLVVGDWTEPTLAAALPGWFGRGLEPVYAPAAGLPVQLALLAASRSEAGDSIVVIAEPVGLKPLIVWGAQYGRLVELASGTVEAERTPVGPPRGALSPSDAGLLAVLASAAPESQPAVEPAEGAALGVESPPVPSPGEAPRVASRPMRLVPDLPPPTVPSPFGRLESFDEEHSGASHAARLRQVVEPLRALQLEYDAVGWAEDVEWLHAAVAGRSAWALLTADEQRALLTYVAAAARHLQQVRPSELLESVRLAEVFRWLTAFSRKEQPGTVNGLAQRQKAERATWFDDSVVAFDLLRDLAGIGNAAQQAARLSAIVPVRRSVTAWAKEATPERLARVESSIKAAYAAGVPKDDPRLAAEVVAVVGRKALAGKEFRFLRAAVEALPSDPPPPGKPLRSKAAAEPGLCGDALCAAVYAARQPGTEIGPAGRKNDCVICHGSDNERHVARMILAMDRAGLERMLVVGGFNKQGQELERLVRAGGKRIDRVSGQTSPDTTKLKALDNGADLVVVWTPATLHRMTEALGERDDSVPRFTIAPSGTATLARQVTDRLELWLENRSAQPASA